MNNKNQNDPPDQSERNRILKELDRSLLVEAAAGTGKTTIMVRRMIALLESGKAHIHNIAAITFTKKATAEIRSRFQLELEETLSSANPSANPLLSDAMANIEKCFVGTIHSFCGKLLRERPVEAGLGLSFREIDEDEDSLLRRKAWETHVEGLYSRDRSTLREIRDHGLEVKDLWHAFKTYANFPDVDEWPIDPVEPLDLTGIQRLLSEAADDARKLETFPGLTYKTQDDLMRRYARIARMVHHADLSAVSQCIPILKELKKNAGVESDKWPGGKDQAKEELATWYYHRERALTYFCHWTRLAHPILMKVIQPAQQLYDQMRAELGFLSYQDLLLKAAALLRDHPHVRDYFKKRFTHILVDEFQDTDPVQAEVMMLLTATSSTEKDWRKCRPERGRLFVVGDPKQSIYRFRRADIVTYNKVKEILDYDGQGVVKLQANFRSAEGVVQWVNNTFSEKFHGPSQVEPEYVELYFARAQTQGASCPAILPHRIRKPLSNSTNEEIIDVEAERIARTIRCAIDTKAPMPRTAEQLAAGTPTHACFDDFLIVTVKKKHLGVFAKKLQKYGIPHQVTGGNALQQFAELTLLEKCLACVTQPDNPVALVAALRSELFGISDHALYEFKKAGGTFSFLSEFPSTYFHDEATALSDALSRLKQYYGYFNSLPPVVAMEIMIADLGLLARAALEAEGNFQVGSLLKAIEILRSTQRSAWSVTDLVTCLQSLVKGNPPHDGIAAVEETTPVVRVMNLHKVKGLEAPIVFLADPSGDDYEHPISVHIDRTGDKTQGHLALHDPNRDFHPPEIAVPRKWEYWEEIEKEFRDAENTRLMYVAATRARDQLVVVQRESYNNRNPWSSLEKALKQHKEEFEAPPGTVSLNHISTKIEPDQVASAQERFSEHWTKILAPTYGVAGIKAISVGKKTVSLPGREHGTEWGTVIHSLLENAMLAGTADLTETARSLLKEQGFTDPDAYLDEALGIVRSVMESPLWSRARKSPQCLTEVPFQIMSTLPSRDGTPVETILRGAIDLVFLEADEWVIVDYKSDSVQMDQLPDLVDHYQGQVATYAQAWEKMTGTKVAERGLYFTHLREYMRC